MDNCVFCKIVKGEIPSAKLYEDDDMIVIKDLEPQAKVHLLHYSDITQMSDEQAATLARCLKTLASLVDSFGLSDGFRMVSNKGKHGCQSVPHLHIHILGGEQLHDKMC